MRLAEFPTAVYAGLQCLAALAFNVLFHTIAVQREDAEFRQGARLRRH
jgi:hypothetical protein